MKVIAPFTSIMDLVYVCLNFKLTLQFNLNTHLQTDQKPSENFLSIYSEYNKTEYAEDEELKHFLKSLDSGSSYFNILIYDGKTFVTGSNTVLLKEALEELYQPINDYLDNRDYNSQPKLIHI